MRVVPGLALQALLVAQEAPSRRPVRPVGAVPYSDLFRATCGARYADRVAQSYVESRWNPRAVSPVGAQGLLQAMPATWAWYQAIGWVPRGSSPFDPAPAIAGGHRHMAYLEALFHGDQVAAWASFNTGQGRVLRVMSAKRRAGELGLVQPNAWLQLLSKETRDYVVRIPATRERLKAQGVL